jgi:hypothetical protein
MKFKIGDRVRVTRNDYTITTKGSTGVVRYISHEFYYIKWDNLVNADNYGLTKIDLELINKSSDKNAYNAKNLPGEEICYHSSHKIK